MSAKPIYCITLIFDIGAYRGEWDGHEERMERQHTTLCQSESREFAELLYKRIAKESLKPEGEGKG